MTVIPFPAHRRHWRRREPLSVRAALAMVGGFCLLLWGALAWLVSLAIG
jgi:hypothetical protein